MRELRKKGSSKYTQIGLKLPTTTQQQQQQQNEIPERRTPRELHTGGEEKVKILFCGSSPTYTIVEWDY